MLPLIYQLLDFTTYTLLIHPVYSNNIAEPSTYVLLLQVRKIENKHLTCDLEIRLANKCYRGKLSRNFPEFLILHTDGWMNCTIITFLWIVLAQIIHLPWTVINDTLKSDWLLLSTESNLHFSQCAASLSFTALYSENRSKFTYFEKTIFSSNYGYSCCHSCTS